MNWIKSKIENIICNITNKNTNDCKTIYDLSHILQEIHYIKKPCCNLPKLSEETDGFTKINGKKLPGKLEPLVNSVELLNITNAQGQKVKIVKSIRKPNTRVGIHVHKYGGYTLILSGEMTDFVQGQPIKKYKANSGYYMPPCTPMSAANLGKEDVVLIDIFIGEPCEPYISILEPNWPASKVGVFDCN